MIFLINKSNSTDCTCTVGDNKASFIKLIVLIHLTKHQVAIFYCKMFS